MEQTKGPLGSQMQIQQRQQQQNQSKKKSKNKKKSSKNVSAVVTRPIDEQQKQQQEHHQPSSEGVEVTVMENGLTDQLKQQLHIGNNSSSSCSKSNSNNNKVNGLMKENFNKSSKACPPTLNDLQIDKKLQSSPALNGHHHRNHHLPVQEDDTATVGSSMTNKKSKRKPNNKKNTNTLENKSNYSNNLENGHCPANTMVVTTNGFQHKQVEEQPQQTDTTNTAIKANKTNATNSTTSVTTNSETNINNNTTPNGVRAETSEVKQKQQPSTHLDTLSSCTSQITEPTKELDLSNVNIEYKEYESELQMHDIMRLIQAELSEPYSIYTYRYFIYNWPKLCFLAAHGNEYVGAIVCKLDMHMNVRRGYIAMLAVRKEYRKLKIGTTLVQKAIEAMLADKADEVVLETEMSNLPALRLYENLGFVRDKRLFRYYLNGVDALRLKLWFR